ncbi:MAG TPA: RNA polymerase sigma-70 factor [Chloroflexia bacterium]|nr:RNA polymerase sigma-70 factor [Chloroflexia bacterium]
MDEFETYRPLLFGIAYRMLASASEAEDIVQEAYLRYHAAPAGEIRTLKAYLTTIVTHLCLDHLKSARVQREQYVGPWLPEPLITTDAGLTPLQTLEQQESIALAFLVLLECLTPQERAVFLLHDVFDYTTPEIAEVLGKSAANCRQIVHRARERLAERRRRFAPAPVVHRRLTEQFLVACTQGDVAGLTTLLAQDVTTWSDGGGRVTAARNLILGRENSIRFLIGVARKTPAAMRATLEEVNGVPAFLLWLGDALNLVGVLDIVDEQVQGIHFMLNPDKLAYIAAQVRARGE